MHAPETSRRPSSALPGARWSDGGALVNFLAGPHVGPADVRAAYEPDRFARLVEIKTAWDPDNVFRINHNIPPRADEGGS